MHYAFTEAAFEDMTQLIPLSFALMLILLAVLAGGHQGHAGDHFRDCLFRSRRDGFRRLHGLHDHPDHGAPRRTSS